jgi:hypothetical protein
MKTTASILATVLCVLGFSVIAEARGPAPAEEPAIAGKWSLTVESPIGSQVSVLELRVDGKKITGSSSRDDNQPSNKIAGELNGSELTFTMTWMGPNSEVSLTFTGKIKDDGSMSGTATLDGSDPVSWSAKRLKT